MATNPQIQAVPHLTTALTGPLHTLETLLLDHQSHIEHWFREQWRQTPAPFYASVDLRNAGFKLAPVDTNLFPAGFNNLAPEFQSLCVHAVQSAMERSCPTAAQVLIVPESHTRNTFYLASLASLRDIIANAGYSVRIGSLSPEIRTATPIELEDGRSLTLEPLQRRGNRVGLTDFDPCIVVLNNDLSAGRPEILEGIEQLVVPPLALGWSTRRKSDHVEQYRRVAEEFCELIQIDPWLTTPYYRYCGEINFKRREGEDCLAHNTEILLGAIRAKYREYGIEREPFVVVKADSGTYGMGIMTVRTLDDVVNLNRKQRNKMATTKEGLSITRVLIQEGACSDTASVGITVNPTPQADYFASQATGCPGGNHQRLAVSRFADIARYRRHLGHSCQLCGYLLESFRTAGIDNQLPAPSRQGSRQGQTQAAGRAGD